MLTTSLCGITVKSFFVMSFISVSTCVTDRMQTTTLCPHCLSLTMQSSLHTCISHSQDKHTRNYGSVYAHDRNRKKNKEKIKESPTAYGVRNQRELLNSNNKYHIVKWGVRIRCFQSLFLFCFPTVFVNEIMIFAFNSHSIFSLTFSLLKFIVSCHHRHLQGCGLID